MKTLLKRLGILLSTLAMTLMIVAPAPVFAATKDDVCEGLALTGGGNCANSTATAEAESTVNRTIKYVVNLLSFIVGIIAVIMIIVSGIKYITSSGDSNSVNSAKNTLLYAIVGLVVVALAQVIVRFVLTQAAPAPSETSSSLNRRV